MDNNPWKSLEAVADRPGSSSLTWLCNTLLRNSASAYLKQFGAPDNLHAFRRQVPTCSYEDLTPYLERIKDGESDVLFAGKPVAFERTGGSSGGAKLIPYSLEGLLDFQQSIVPWLARVARDYGITGRAYFSISPATRRPEFIGPVPVGLPDAAYLGEQAGLVLAMQTAVPLEVGHLRDADVWRKQTLEHLLSARDLELISIWSPTFLLNLLDGISDPQQYWPRLKVISCWASGSSHRYAEQLKLLLPRAAIQPKGLLSTEAVITVPGDGGRPALVGNGFFEFATGNDLLLEEELIIDSEYEVVVTTASGLYRYKTGDRVRFEGRNESGHAILEFIGRDSLVSDLVGEKLTETFVSGCLEAMKGVAMLVPDFSNPGYVLICGQEPGAGDLAALENRLDANPQYAYAKKLGQLAPIRALLHKNPYSVIERAMVNRNVRLGDVKPVALRSEAFWLPLFMEASQ
jgi:hypothetical protein